MKAPEGFDTVVYEVAPTVTIFGDEDGRAAAAAEHAGCRVLASAALAAFADGLADAAAATPIVALHRDEGPATDRLLDQIATAARLGGRTIVLILPLALVDLIGARPIDSATILLVEPTPFELAGAIAIASAGRGGTWLGDVGRDSGAMRLIELTEEVARIARQLALLSDQGLRALSAPPALAEAPVMFAAPPAGPAGPAGIRARIRARRLRDQYFGSELFADPAWDILLDLAAARKEGRGVAVSSLCIAAAVPPTTALRWIGKLEEDGLLVRRADPHDGRRVFIALADEAAERMDTYLVASARLTGG